MGTKNNPGSYDCYKNAEPDEPMFVLLGRDPMAAILVGLWVEFRREMGETDAAKLEEASACARQLEEWARQHGKNVEAAQQTATAYMANEIADGILQAAAAIVQRRTSR